MDGCKLQAPWVRGPTAVEQVVLERKSSQLRLFQAGASC